MAEPGEDAAGVAELLDIRLGTAMISVPTCWPRCTGAGTGESKATRAASCGRNRRGIVTTMSCAATIWTVSDLPSQTGTASIGCPALNRV